MDYDASPINQYDANYVWRQHLNHILALGADITPRGQNTKEILGAQTRVAMSHPIVTNLAREMGFKFLFAEAWWILSGRRDVASILPYAKSLRRFSNDGYQFDGAYGPMICEQMRYVVDTLLDDPASRQAVITIWRPNPRSSKDIPCTVSLQFIMRPEGSGTWRLHCIANMRSSDAWLGWVYDVFNFTMITTYVGLRIREESIMDLCPVTTVKLGHLILNMGSAHIYERNLLQVAQAHHCYEELAYEPISIDDYTDATNLIESLAFAKDNIKTEKGKLCLPRKYA